VSPPNLKERTRFAQCVDDSVVLGIQALIKGATFMRRAISIKKSLLGSVNATTIPLNHVRLQLQSGGRHGNMWIVVEQVRARDGIN